MSLCLVCGKEINGCICDECKSKTDIEQLCNSVMRYKPCWEENPDKNELWDSISSEMDNAYNFRNIAFALAEELPTPRKELVRISVLSNNLNMPRDNRLWFYEVYDRIVNSEDLSDNENQRIKALMLETLYREYKYIEAEALAVELCNSKAYLWQTCYNLAEYYSQTRRYDEAELYIETGKNMLSENSYFTKKFNELSDKNKTRQSGKSEYLPKPNTGKEEAKEKYISFLASLGIEVERKKDSRYPDPIPKDEYPEPVEKREADFDSFVAFDFETTGTNTAIDAIIEVGAVRVVNGVITESAEFTFQEFVRPFKKSVSDYITELTGITKDDVKSAREMWEVIPDFMRFVGDDILVGYNSIGFDSKFLVRAGRYSKQIYANKHFDVFRYLSGIKSKIGYDKDKLSLGAVSEFLGIKNPEAHRALADAITTARVYLKLKELNPEESSDLELDLEEW